ncbi:MAG: Transcriptional regulator of heat shock protein [Candidatus Magasanikbacteria bacterium GW2011_GWA2_56_11]|uniref:Transcriptional regulator of heat shock protein n=1 Tax=Candidatus Magasanikbacteria bacterium GW2011_GWA2_56_11 TaxID=1619044 RepID=A0A0G1YDU7_9BACT|nr:MAG: Transcriptional regulator of heat shock protein [Candidatus Magasanikbacteria bacterium GW2011_GWA2_56_11]
MVAENYIKTAEPVGSKFLVDEYRLEWSDATVRNELRELEDEGYLTHPHTSAGRLPTEAGYRYYVEHLMEVAQPAKKLKGDIEEFGRSAGQDEQALKQLGKIMAGEVSNAVLIAFGAHRVYYTGISYLFAQPEFQDMARTVDISAVFDQCEERLDDVFDRLSAGEPRVLIGEENPLSGDCSLVGARLSDERFLTILGPLRMDYAKSLGILRYMYAFLP